MTHVWLILAALGVAAVGVLILVLSRCASTVAIGAGSGFVLLALALAIPAQLEAAKDALASVATAIKGALDRRTPAP